MSEFVLTGQDVFGKYCKIAYGHKIAPDYKQDYHIYKAIQSFRSNCYCDTPLTYQTENNPYVHDEMVDVVDVIHCGIDETKVIRVAAKDVEFLPEKRNTADWVLANPMTDTVTCSNCDYNLSSSELLTPYCPWCGSLMLNYDEIREE